MTDSSLEPGRPHRQPEERSRHGRLTFRRQDPATRSSRTGLLAFEGSSGEPVGLAYVPTATGQEPLRLVLLLHGAGGAARQALELLLSLADEHGLLLVAPKSRRATWDVILEGYGPDVRVVDRLLDDLASDYPVKDLAVGGFSDGASYALSLGIGNGDVFDSVLAFSPGFFASLVRHGRPRIFVSHGTRDRVLPIDRCSRRLVPELTESGYDVTYHEFDGAHEVPASVVRAAATWLTQPLHGGADG